METICNPKLIDNACKLGKTTILFQTMEECGELIQAISKYNRTQGFGQKTEVKYKEAYISLIEEIADVSICIDQLILMLECGTEVYECREKALEKVASRYKKK